MYPDPVNPIIRTLDSTSAGLDFVSAIESDLIVFVEGTDDAKLMHHLFYQPDANRTKKIMFWVLGSVSKILGSISTYRQFFCQIKNGRCLWDKSCIVFDKDRMMSGHLESLVAALNDKMDIQAKSLPVYTQESVLLTDTHLLSELILTRYGLVADERTVASLIVDASAKQLDVCRSRYAQDHIDDSFVKNYEGQYITKMNETLECGIKIGDIALSKALADFYKEQPLEALANKEDVISVINYVLAGTGYSGRYEEGDFLALARLTDASMNFGLWKDLSSFLTSMTDKGKGTAI